MKITKKTKKIIEQDVIIDVLCNLCGKSCLLGNLYDKVNMKTGHLIKSKNREGNQYGGLVETEVHGCYESNELRDAMSYKFSICEKCLCSLMKKFKIEVEVKGEWSGDYLPESKYEKKAKKSREDVEKLHQQYLLIKKNK
jgi:hypothetical protein